MDRETVCDKMMEIKTNEGGQLLSNLQLTRFLKFVAVSLIILLNSVGVHAQSTPGESARSFGAVFLMAYLPNGQIPLRPNELPVRRWKKPVKIFFDEQYAPIETRGRLLEKFRQVLTFIQANTTLTVNEVKSEEDANVTVSLAGSNEIERSIPIERLTRKYYGSWIGGVASDLSDFKKQVCVANSLADLNGEIQAAVVLIHPDILPAQSERCIVSGLMHALGFDGALPADEGNSVFSSVPELVEIGQGDAAILRRLYGPGLAPIPLTLSDFIMQVDPNPLVTP